MPEETPRYDFTPYGPGAAVQVTSTKPVTVYVVKPLPDGSRPLDYAFKRVGITPVTFQLPPGRYLLEVESSDTTRGGMLLDMGQSPRRLLVDAGSDSTSMTGTLLMAVGVTAIAAGIVVLVGGSTSSEGNLEKAKIVIPFFAGGALVLGGGIALFVVSRTDIEEEQHAPAQAAGWDKLPAVAKAPNLTLGFRF